MNIFIFMHSQISAAISCCYNDPIVELPITIGTYPLEDNVPPLNVQAVQPHSIEVTDANAPLLSQNNNVIMRQPTNRSNYSTINPSTLPRAPPAFATNGKLLKEISSQHILWL